LIQDDGKRVSDYLFVVGYEYLAFGRCCGWRIRHAEGPQMNVVRKVYGLMLFEARQLVLDVLDNDTLTRAKVAGKRN
jgi:hypothetical protein